MTFVLRGQNAKIGAHILCENKVNVTTTENSASNRKEWFSLNRRATPPAKAGIRPVLQTLLHHIYISSAPYPTIFEELRRRASKLGYVSCKWYISSSVSDILYKKKGMSMERIFPPPPKFAFDITRKPTTLLTSDIKRFASYVYARPIYHSTSSNVLVKPGIPKTFVTL